MLLGIHIIARNEADVLARCLESVKHIADEIIVADTGSTDQTVDIALQYGARVLHVDWQDDFSAARNKVLEQSRTIWALVLDADEWLDRGEGAALRQELKRTASAALRVRMVHKLDDYTNGMVLSSEALRLFRADRGFQYVGEIHEQLVRIRIKEGKSIVADIDGPLCESGLLIAHDGYKPSVIQRKNKAERNLRIIARQLSKRPNDPFCLYNYGVTLCQQGRLEEAARAFSGSIEATPLSAPYRPALVKDYAKILLALSRHAEAAELLTRETEGYADYPDIHLLYGESLTALGLLPEAKAAYECAIAAGKMNATAYITENGAGSYHARTLLAAVLQRLGETEEAYAQYELALSEAPQWESALLGLANLMQYCGENDSDIRKELAFYTGIDRSDQIKLLARMLTRIGAYGAALPLWRTTAGINDPSIEIEVAPGHLSPDQEEEAIQASASALLGCTPTDVRLFSECLIGTGQYAEAEDILEYWMVTSDVPVKQENLTELTVMMRDWLLCCWNEGKRMSGEKLAFILMDRGIEHGFTTELNAWLPVTRPEAITSRIASANDLAQAAIWLERAVEHGMLRLAKRLSDHIVGLHPLLETLLYDHGYVDVSAELMLRRFGAEGRLGQEQAFRLGELLYDRRMFTEALSLFETSIGSGGEGGGFMKAQLGAAAACLQLAIEALLPDEYSGGRSWDGSWSEPDRKRLEKALLRMDGLGWRTNWNGLQRRRANGGAAEADFLVHDR